MNFYYDESFHDRKITQNDEGVLNNYLEYSNDSFIYVILGFNNELKAIDEYFKLENDIKKSLGLHGELKSTTFNKKNFKYGFKSMKKQCKEFYYKFLNFIIDNNVIFQIGMISKTEYIIYELFKSLKIPKNLDVDINSFIYSLTKFVDRHRLNKLFMDAFDESKNNVDIFKDSLIDLLKRVYMEIDGIVREERESIAIYQLILILSLSKNDNTTPINNNWDYSIIAEGIKKRLLELNMMNSKIYVDNEKNTYKAFLEAGFSVSELDSKESINIRMVDMLVGFIGRFVGALNESLKEPDLNCKEDIKRDAYVNKRIIDNEWFNLDIETFKLYKKIGSYFSKTGYWSSFTMIYFDNALLFFSLFNYINSYGSYEEFVKNIGIHNEYFNTFCCNCLEDRFKGK